MRQGKRKSTGILVDSSMSVSSVTLLSQLRILVEEKIGHINVAKVVLLQEQAQNFAKEIALNGFLPVIVHDDLDVHFVLEAMELVYKEKIRIIVIMTENENLLPLLVRAREQKEVYLIQANADLSRSLQNAVDGVIPLRG